MALTASFVESVPASPSCGSMAVENDEDHRINEVLRRMWLYIHTYTMRFTDKVDILIYLFLFFIMNYDSVFFFLGAILMHIIWYVKAVFFLLFF